MCTQFLVIFHWAKVHVTNFCCQPARCSIKIHSTTVNVTTIYLTLHYTIYKLASSKYYALIQSETCIQLYYNAGRPDMCCVRNSANVSAFGSAPVLLPIAHRKGTSNGWSKQTSSVCFCPNGQKSDSNGLAHPAWCPSGHEFSPPNTVQL